MSTTGPFFGRRWGLRLAIVLVVAAGGVAIGSFLLPHTPSSPSPDERQHSTGQTAFGGIHDDCDWLGLRNGYKASVTVPDSFIEKLAKIWHPDALEIIWPGFSALRGAAVGGGVTLWANRQTNSAASAAASFARRTQIRDRSFGASVDVIKTGQLYYNEANNLWWDLQTHRPQTEIDKHEASFDEALEITTPPTQ